MNRISSFLLTTLLTFGATAQNTINIMDSVVFYDGYASTVNDTTPTGVIRFRNDLVSTKLSSQQLTAIGDELTINVTISALCDNYDRIGSVNLALVPTGSNTYDPANVAHIEIGRFITPFMNKNVQPTSVPYSFEVNNIAQILKSGYLTTTYDYWLELEVFGVPYAANTQISGCSGRNDVFQGKVDFVSNGPVSGFTPNTFLESLSFKADFNNYQANATDSVGTTVKTIVFTTAQTVYDARFYLITSNHGANSGGEEYVRRIHYVDFDGNPVLTYTPGGKSCEPYRQYNTQSNGIYGNTPQSTSWWTSWNNWCPGDVIPIREIILGDLSAGSHTFRISVPDAQFSGQNGNFPLSLYLQGSNTEVLSVEAHQQTLFTVFPNPSNNTLNIQTEKDIEQCNIFDSSGKLVKKALTTPISLTDIDTGVYFIQVNFIDGMVSRQRFIKQ